MKKKLFPALAGLALLLFADVNVNAQDGFIGEIKMVAFTFAPRGWAECNGQLLSISENTALFSLLGTTYGGDGRTTFGLPDLRGRVPVGVGQGTGLEPVKQGDKTGKKAVPVAATKEKTEPDAVVQPSIGMRYVICIQGIFPSRN